MLQVINTGSHSASENMALDEELLLGLDAASQPILHLYRWDRPSLTFGYFIDPSKYLDLNKLQQCGVDQARRPTGGGIVFHIWDLAFSFLLPAGHPRFSFNTHENYRFVNETVLEAVLQFLKLPDPAELIPANMPPTVRDAEFFCMARPTIYDVVYQGRKIAGAAQRRRKNGYLHQGTISLAFPDMALLKEVLLSSDDLAEAMAACSFAPLGHQRTASMLESMRREIQKRLADKLQAKL